MKICLAASAGGHLSQLLALAPVWEGHTVAWITSLEVGSDRLRKQGTTYVVGEGNRNHPLLILRMAWGCLRAIWVERPDLVLSTGAAPGLLACLFGRLLGARAIWVDSIANTPKMSLSGRLARHFVSQTFCQWPDVAARYPGVEYAGEVI